MRCGRHLCITSLVTDELHLVGCALLCMIMCALWSVFCELARLHNVLRRLQPTQGTRQPLNDLQNKKLQHLPRIDRCSHGYLAAGTCGQKLRQCRATWARTSETLANPVQRALLMPLAPMRGRFAAGSCAVSSVAFAPLCDGGALTCAS